MKKLLIILAMATLFTCCKQDFNESKKPDFKEPVKVKIAKVEASQQQSVLKYSGTIEAAQTIPLTFQTIGIVDKIYVEEGDFVKEGQLLAEVEKGSLLNAYQGALAKYEQATDAQTRLKKVYDNASLPEIKWVEINSQVSQAKAMLEVSERNLENCELRAPTSGIIGERNIEPGMSAIQITAPIKLVKIETVMAKISVPENEISLMEKDFEAQLCVAALDRKLYTGQISRIGVVANQLSKTYEVKIRVENRDLKLKPGMVCEVEISLPATESVLTVPMSSVNRDAYQMAFVYTVNPATNLAVKKQVQLNGILDDELVIASGLKLGDLVIVSGNQKIANQTKVTY